jgi:NAD-dependent dihydropyrimidine dehydrogenase PreA subunit
MEIESKEVEEGVVTVSPPEMVGGAETPQAVLPVGKPSPTDLSRRIVVYRRWCKACGICVAFCPPKALESAPDGYPYLARPEACTDCGICEIRCPDFAITNHPLRDKKK